MHYSFYIYSTLRKLFNEKYEKNDWKMFEGLSNYSTGEMTGVISINGIDHKISISPIQSEINTRKILKFTRLMRLGGVQL